MIFRIHLETLQSRTKSSLHFKQRPFSHLCLQARCVQLKPSTSSSLTHVICNRSFVRYSGWRWCEVTEDAFLELKARVTVRNIPMRIRVNCGSFTLADDVPCRTGFW